MGEFEKDVSALCLLAAPSSLPHLERPGRTFRGKTTQRNRDTFAAITPHLSITASVASTDVSPSLSCSRSPPPSDAMEREDYGTARGGGGRCCDGGEGPGGVASASQDDRQNRQWRAGAKQGSEGLTTLPTSLRRRERDVARG